MRHAFASKLKSLAEVDSRIILISGDLGYGVLDEFRTALPKQFLNCGVAEQSMMSLAAGLASQGFRPFVYSIANFPTFRCLEQIRNDIAYMRNPVTIVSVGAGVAYGVHGYSHHAIEDIAIISSLGGVSIYSPADSLETMSALERIIKVSEPAYLRLGKGGEPLLSSTPICKEEGVRVLQDGPDGAILFTGSVGTRALAAADLLKTHGLSPTIVSVPFLNFDNLSLFLKKKNFRFIVTVEEHLLRNGFGTMIIEIVNSLRLSTNVVPMGLTDEVKYLNGSANFLMDHSNLTPEEIAACVISGVKS